MVGVCPTTNRETTRKIGLYTSPLSVIRTCVPDPDGVTQSVAGGAVARAPLILITGTQRRKAAERSTGRPRTPPLKAYSSMEEPCWRRCWRSV